MVLLDTGCICSLGFIDYRRLDYLREILRVLVNECTYKDKFS